MPIKILEYTLSITVLLSKLKCTKCRIWNPPNWVLTNMEPTKFGSYLKHEFLNCIGVNSHKGVTLYLEKFIFMFERYKSFYCTV